MMRYGARWRSVLGGLLLGVLTLPVQAQEVRPDTTAAPDTTAVKEVEVENANALQVEGAEVHLRGAVRLRQDETRLRSNRATEYTERGEYLFLGDVLIVERGDTLRAERVRYDKRRKIGYATGQVRLSDGEVTVVAPSGEYYLDEKRAVFRQGVMLVDSATVLTSEQGAYWSSEKRAEFYDRVRLTGDRTYLEADTVTYFRETEVALARGNVFIERLGGEEGARVDTATRTFLFGARAFNDNRAAHSRVEGHPLLVQLRTDSTGMPVDTLLVRARRLETARRDSLQQLTAVDSVRIWQRRLAAVADSVVYERRRLPGGALHEESRLYRGPMTWFQQAQVHGDTIRVTARDGAVDSLQVRDGFVARRDTVLDRISQLRGRTLLGLFERDTLRTLHVAPNAQAIHFLRDEKTNALKGAVQVSGDYIRFNLAGEGALQDIRVYRGVEGTYYETVLIPATLELEGFRWAPARRPVKATLLPPDLLDRLDRRMHPAAPRSGAVSSKNRP